MKGIILAGGSGTRLYPLTLVTSKQLLPIYDKPMVYYPLSVLMMAGIKEILIISTPQDIPNFERLLGDGSQFGINLSYMVQPEPEGLAQAFTLGKDFIGDNSCSLILGDNIFYGSGLIVQLQNAVKSANDGCATVFGYWVEDPERFGIMEFDEQLNVLSVEEKPEKPKSNYCITGLYFYPAGVAERAALVEKSDRGEYEITTLNEMYLQDGLLKAKVLGRGYTWLDTGTMDSLLQAANFVEMIEKRQSVLICAPEEIAYRNGWISLEELKRSVAAYGKSNYGKHLNNIVNRKYVY